MKIIFSIFLTVIFAMHSSWADVTPQKIEFTIFDNSVKPIAGAKLSITVKKGDVESGFLSTKVNETDILLECISSTDGKCHIDAFLTYSKITDSKVLSININSIENPSAKLAFSDSSINYYISKSEPLLLIKKNIFIEGEFARVGDPKYSVPVELVKKSIEVTSDELDLDISVNTFPVLALYEDYYKKYTELANNSIFRAWVPKNGTPAKYQLYGSVSYTSSNGSKLYETINYQTVSGPKSAILKRIDTKVKRDSMYGVTHKDPSIFEYTEIVTLELSEDELRGLVKDYKSGSDKLWKFRLNAKSGDKKEQFIPLFVIAGLLEKIDEIKPVSQVKKNGKTK